MVKATQAHLQSVSAYVPEFILDQALADPSASLEGWEERLEVALLFADASGFTAMSERLAQLGKEGAEELTRVLNAYFSTMIDLVRNYGGQIIKFGGDALTCAFLKEPVGDAPSEVTLNQHAHLVRACACALAMQDEMAQFQEVRTRGGTFELQMKIGISAGPVLFLSLGDRREGLEYVLAGHPLDRMAEAEHHATAGEVVIDTKYLANGDTSWENLGVVIGERRDGFSPVVRLTRTVEKAERKKVDWAGLSEDVTQRMTAQLVPYLPQTVYERIVEGQRQFVGEHRRVVSLFVNFVGLDYDGDPEAGHKLQRYFVAMQEIIHRFGGRLNWISTGDKGSLLHLIFGAPVAHEDDEVRAVGCALEMQQRVAESGELSFITDQRIGIASGDVFAGDVGSERRRGYTVMGDVVNLSARLMQAAERGSILLDQRTARYAGGDFVCEKLEPIRVKGKQEPVAICQAVGLREESKAWLDGGARARRRESPFVGRKQELTQLDAIIERAVAGRGQLLVITGEAGVGKSRLLEELVTSARQKAPGMRGLGGDCLSYASQTPYLPWIDLLTSLFGLRPGEAETTDDRVRRVEQRMVEANPELGNWAPLMGQLLGLPVPDNELTASLDAQLRKQRTFDITLNLLRHQASQTPLFLMVFEDVHWIDTISLELLNYVARNIADHRILVVALHRPSIELSEWARYDYHHRIDLTDLPTKDALSLIKLRLGMENVPEQLLEKVLHEEEQTNPFFVEESINSLIDRGYLVESNGQGYRLEGDLTEVEIPDSVQALVMSRIDRLDESSKLTIKVASTIGSRFRRLMLQGIYPVQITTERLWENLTTLNERDLTPLDAPAPEWEYVFKNIITRDVAYESLLFAHRRELHHRVGEYVERAYPDNLEEYYELLAHHYYQSGDSDKSWEYLIRAGDKAKDRYANEAAITQYRQALSIDFGPEPDAGPRDVYRVHESLGDVYRLIGQYENALESYGEALSHEPPTITQTAEIRRKIAKTRELQGRYDEAMLHIRMAHTTLSEEPQTPEMARVYSDMGWIAMRQGDYKEALRLCANGLDVAESLPPDERSHRVRARLQYTLGMIYWRMVDYPQAITHLQTCISMQESIGDLQRMGGVYNNLAVVYWSQSDYAVATKYFRESLEISQKIGDTYGTAQTLNNLGVIYYTLGDYARAIEHYERSLGTSREIGDLLGIALAYTNLGEVYHSLEDDEKALGYLQEAVGLFKEIGDKTNLVDAYRLVAEVELELSDTDKALEYCQLSLDLAQEIGDQEYEGIAYRVLGQIHRTAGRPEEARKYLQSSVETLTTIGNKLEMGKSHYELGLTLSAMGLAEGRVQLETAIQIFQELGVEGELEKARAALAAFPEQRRTDG
jgi:class 3 adenylate cyclase/tetratricopeptide (TPR) repeat protein